MDTTRRTPAQRGDPLSTPPHDFDQKIYPIVAQHIFGLRPIGLISDTVVIDLARRTGRLPRYHQLLESEICR